ncbi:hypothetical protein BH24ACT22_BH24ACT22_14420 [soil metagenome]
MRRANSVFRPRLPGTDNMPKELSREDRHCERCGEPRTHILYEVPKKVALVYYVRKHDENLQATCLKCARSTVLRGEERERVLDSLK